MTLFNIFSNFYNFFFRKFGRPAFFSASRSAFLHFVSIIGSPGSQKQMTGIYTNRIVAFMKHALAVWNFPTSQFISNSMCSVYKSFYTKFSIFMLATCLPFPTRIKNDIYFRPESTRNRAIKMVWICCGKVFVAIKANSWFVIKSHFSTSLANLVRGLKCLYHFIPFFIIREFKSQE